MLNSDVEGIKVVSQGILISDINSDEYEILRNKKLAEHRQQNRINTIEQRMDSIETMLQQILQKVT